MTMEWTKFPLFVIAGPCVIESEELCMQVAGEVKRMCAKLGLGYVFKASFDKANRSSASSYRGPGVKEGVEGVQFIDGVLWGGLQYADGARQYGVKKSLFYHDPAALPTFQYDSSINWGSWTSWNKAAAGASIVDL